LFTGHGRGAGSTIGIAADGSQRPLPSLDPPLRPFSKGTPGTAAEYDADYGLQCVRHGYVVFALETIGFGMRRDAQTQQDHDASHSTCLREAMAALMLGETLPGWRVWDAQRALDLLETRPEIDANRLGVMGISGGGLVALFAAALDTRIATCVVSCYFNSFAESVLAIDHCSDNYVPGLLNVCEMPDLAALVAPRILVCEGGSEDDIFPVAAFENAVRQARKIYAAFDCPQSFSAHTFEGGHLFHGEAAFAFLNSFRQTK
jgi:dienelactone hydrolase